MYRYKLSILLYPLVPHAEPCLHNIQRTCILGQFQAIGVILSISVRIVIGEFIQHVIYLFHRLRRFCDTHCLCPVGAVG